ncbi:MAG: RHS repeat domain-containing protein [Thermoanaerobaculia bacterium]
MVDYVDLAAFDGTPAHWNFTYVNDGAPTTVFRDCRQNNGTTLGVPVLASVSRPDGALWSFSHYNDDPGSQGIFCRQSVLSDLTFPSGGRIHYDYQDLQLPVNDPCPDPLGFGEVRVTAVATRSFIDQVVANPAQAVATWEYEYFPVAAQPQDVCGDPELEFLTEELNVRVWSPLNDKTDFYFSVWAAFDDSLNGFTRSEYGLPFTRPETSGGRHLSSIAYDCDANRQNCSAVREEYVTYEQDPGGVRANRRVQASRTVYLDDNGTFADVESSNFDGVGHYRRAEKSGSFATGNIQTVFTNFNPLRGIYPGSYVLLPASEPWILGTYDRVDVVDDLPANMARRLFDFESTTGFLKSIRTCKGDDCANLNDLFSLYCRDSMGNLTSELFYGGDGTRFQLPGTLPSCDSGPPASGWQYRLDHTYSGGARSTSKYSGATHFLLDRTINAQTGLASSSRDSAGVETQFVFDDLGRLRRSIPQSFAGLERDAQTEYSYPAANVVEVERCAADLSNCTSANRLSYEKTETTGFGSPWHELREMPGSSDWAVRVTRYNSMGAKARESSWVYDADGQFPNENSLPATVYDGFDAFGRPGSITLPDLSVTTLLYEGVQWVGTQQSVATAINGSEQCVGRWERFDRQGRLDRVEEGYLNCTGSVGMNTEYRYDESGRLVRVCQDTVDGTSCGQTRLFDYDNRGFLLSEQHPEKGSGGNGLVSYACYDARGHARYRDDGATSRRLAYTYDGLERLMRVRVPLGTESCNSATETGTTWKEFAYATANSGSNARKGKLEITLSRNELGPPAFPANSFANVFETYTYQDRGGRASKRVTAVSGPGVVSETWEVAQTTDPLGLLAVQNYPICTLGPDCADTAGPRATTQSYESGLLQTIVATGNATLLSGITYHASGMPNVISHRGTQLVETISQASHGMARPSSITLTSPSATPPNTFTTGTYGYDGAGNVKAMGSDHFRYDRYHRLLESQMGSLSPSQSQTTTFDGYGNVTAMTTNGTGVNFPTSGVTNRLTSAAYDAGGNTTSWNGNSYSWDLFNRMTHWSNGSEGWSYVYTADDERLWSIKDVAGAGHTNWTIRGFGNQVLTRDERRPASPLGGPPEAPSSQCPTAPPGVNIFCDDFESGDTSAWGSSGTSGSRVVKDYIYRGRSLLAVRDQDGDYSDFGLDHLGTIRVATNLFGQLGSIHTYFPFGREATSPDQDTEVMKFTGHERDLQSTPGATADDLDYMHARYSSPVTGRFLSVDSHLGYKSRPQSWNRYAYALGNPLKYSDPDGNEIVLMIPDLAMNGMVKRAMTEGASMHTRLGSMVQRLSSSEFKHKIALQSGFESGTVADVPAASKDGSGTGSSISLSLTTTDEDGNIMSLVETLMHEFSHSEDMDSGTVDVTRTCDTCPPADEQKAVRMQNLARPGQPRTVFGTQQVPNPTAVPPKPPKKKREEPEIPQP